MHIPDVLPLPLGQIALPTRWSMCRRNRIRSITKRFKGLEVLQLSMEPDSFPSEHEIVRLR